MSDTIQFKRKSVLHWDTVHFDGLFLTLRELQRAIALKRFPDLLDRAEEAIEVSEGNVKLTDPLKQIPRGSKVPISVVRIEERKHDFSQRRAAGSATGPAVGDGRETAAAAAAGAAIFEDDADLIEHRLAADSAPAPPAMRGRGRGFRGGSFRGEARPRHCRICGLEGHEASECPHKDAERKVRVTGIPLANLVPDEKGTLLLNGNIPARIQTDEQAFQQYVGNRAQPATLPASAAAPATALEAPRPEAPLALTQFPHSEAASTPQGPPAALPQLAGADMVFEDAFLEEPLPTAPSRSPLPARSPQQDAPNQAQLVRLASMQLRADEAELDRLERKQARMAEPLTVVEFENLKRLPNRIELGRQKREQLRTQIQIEQTARPQLSPARPRHTRDDISRSRSRSRPRRRRSRSRERSPVRRHRSDRSRCDTGACTTSHGHAD